MRTIALATRKGGSGKSTLAIGLAVAAMQDGERVFLLETDRQGTVSKWGTRRANAEPGIEPIRDESGLSRSLELLDTKGYTIAIIDTPAADNSATTAAVRVADFCLIPARPTPVDIEATHPTLATIRGLEKGFAFVLNQAPAGSYRPSKAAETLNAMGVLALPYIVQRNDHQDALGAGLAVSEYAPAGKAAHEIRALWAWVKRKLEDESQTTRETSPTADTPEINHQDPFQSMALSTLKLVCAPWAPWIRSKNYSR
jgi:chromosome partitioning protein